MLPKNHLDITKPMDKSRVIEMAWNTDRHLKLLRRYMNQLKLKLLI